MIINKFASPDPFVYPKVASWKVDKNYYSWDKVKCNKVTSHLVELDLTNSCLYGSINSSSSLFHLVHLTRLSLANNDFNGSKIPSIIKNFFRLSYLNLHNSNFFGQIPSEVLELSKLETLDIMYNFNLKLHKPSLRSLLEKLTQFKVLYLAYVNISSLILDILANLSSLIELSLKGCHLQGEFPAKTFQLPNLCMLNVRFNLDLSGSLLEFQNNSPFEELRVANTSFFGEIPHSIGNLNSLQILDISSCSFWGSIPTSLGNLTKINHLYLNDNQFSGKLPAILGNLSSLEELELSLNNFSSQDCRSLSWMGKYSELTSLHLSRINLAAAFENLSSLKELDISWNNFERYDFRSLSWMAKSSELTFLSLAETNLVGEIPSWLMSLTSLTHLYLSENELTGTIPSQIRNLTQLNLLALNSNKLQGSFPSALYHLENLNLLYLDTNNMSGIVDLDMIASKLINLEYLSLSSNNFSLLINANGHTEFLKLKRLFLASCNLNKFPSFLRNQDQLADLDLSSNNIAGKIPRWFLNVSVDSLLNLNLTNNLLTGFD
ncbi:receptor-like protein 6 [Mangifera indica]|uniref:receptor-like protein 6 n=1 Tax=Mangifera indica TaxID=29780 RepID=UPI001CFB39D3|nr:receptor-like protein 6 [Mangifera indica]